jgi:N-acetylglutamate synthase-like GNAT family acetyltransferase
MVNIRKAIVEDADTLSSIAQDAKRYWGYPEHWLERWREELTISPNFINENDVYVADSDGVVTGFYALVTKGDEAELDHLWVAPQHIGQGVGKELFLHAMQRAAERNFASVDILADPNAEGFYQKMGASRVGESAYDINGEPRVLPRLKIDPRS